MPSQNMHQKVKESKRPVIKLTVGNPITRTADDGRYTTYEITLETSHMAFTLSKSCVRRRYSDLVWLRSWLSRNTPHRNLPAIPPKKFFSARFSEDVIETRRAGYELILRRLLEEGVILSESCLHLFLQTPLSVAEIAECLRNHNIASDVIRTVEAFSVMSPSGDRILYCRDNCATSSNTEMQRPEMQACCLVVGNVETTSDLSDSTDSYGQTTSSQSTSGVQSVNGKRDSSLESSSSDSRDDSASPPPGNGDLRGRRSPEKVTFSVTAGVSVEVVSDSDHPDTC